VSPLRGPDTRCFVSELFSSIKPIADFGFRLSKNIRRDARSSALSAGARRGILFTAGVLGLVNSIQRSSVAELFAISFPNLICGSASFRSIFVSLGLSIGTCMFVNEFVYGFSSHFAALFLRSASQVVNEARVEDLNQRARNLHPTLTCQK